MRRTKKTGDNVFDNELLGNRYKHSLLVRFVFLIVVPLAGLLFYVHTLLVRSIPEEVTVINEPKQAGEISITRDQYGATSIIASTDEGAYYALGYAHAQDRLWQLELIKRVVRGRLSQVFGEQTINQDVWIRTLGIYTAAQRDFSGLSEPAKESLEMYAKGVNDLVSHTSSLPVEFQLLGIKPDPWTAIDSLAWSKMFALSLANNMRAEIAGRAAVDLYDVKKLSDLGLGNVGGVLLGHFNETPQTFDRIVSASNFYKLADVLGVGWEGVGSNAWVVAGKYSANGKPLLANDPHTELQLPSSWYVAHLKGKQLDVTGMTLTGLPVVLLGKNDVIAWGATALPADVQDFYVEQLNPSNPSQYLYEGKWLEFEKATETIEIGDASFVKILPKREPKTVIIKRTVNGPIVSEALGMQFTASLKWTGLQKNDTTYESLFRINYARSWDEFLHAISFHVAPVLNMVYADQENIGYVAAGKIPIRVPHDSMAPGWDSNFDWKGWIPQQQLPSIFNPEKGYIVSANNRMTCDKCIEIPSTDWANAIRAERIEQLLSKSIVSGRSLNVEDMKDIQHDTFDSGAELLRGFIVDTLSSNAAYDERFLGHVRQWDGHLSTDSIGATIFMTWMKNFKMKLLRTGAKEGAIDDPALNGVVTMLAERIQYIDLYDMLKNHSDVWCKERDNCQNELSLSFKQSLAELRFLLGNDQEQWQLSRVHSLVLEHMPFSHAKLLDDFFERRTVSSGSSDSINVAGTVFSSTNGFEQRFGASFRHVISLGDENGKYLYINSTGQSGNVFDVHYDDMIAPYRKGELVEFNVMSRSPKQKTNNANGT